MEKAKPRKEKTDLIEEVMLEDFPAEVLVKIFNFLSNHDIRCGVSLACKRFYELCKDESLVPVKDLCIYGDKWRFYSLRNTETVSDVILQSKKLTSLKIKALNLATTNDLLSIALNACPKLVKLEIVETPEMTTGELHFRNIHVMFESPAFHNNFHFRST